MLPSRPACRLSGGDAAREAGTAEGAAPSTTPAPGAWVCGHANCGCLADKTWAEEIGPTGETLQFCTAHFDEAARPAGWRPALTLQ